MGPCLPTTAGDVALSLPVGLVPPETLRGRYQCFGTDCEGFIASRKSIHLGRDNYPYRPARTKSPFLPSAGTFPSVSHSSR